MSDTNNGISPGIGFKVNTSISLITVILVIIGFLTSLRRSDLAELKRTNEIILQKLDDSSKLQLEDRWRIEAIERRITSIESSLSTRKR